MTATFSCDNCGSLVEKYESNTGENVFCDRSCYGEFSNKGVIVECSNCGNSIEKKRKEARKYDNHYCNKKCQGEFLSEKVEVECSYCNSDLYRKPYQIKTHDNYFCDHECWGEWSSENRIREKSSNWRGGHVEDYGPNWESQRKKALRRDDWQCLRCGIDIEEHYKKFEKSLIVHHIIPLKTFERDFDSANELDNLASVCMECHMRVECLSPEEQKKILFEEDDN